MKEALLGGLLLLATQLGIYTPEPVTVTGDLGLAVLTAPQGGTGIGSATAGQVGTCLKVSDDSPFVYELGACGSGSSAWPFTPATYGTTAVQSSSTPLWLTAGFPSLVATSTFATYASSTQLTNSGDTYLTGLSEGNLYLGSNSVVQTAASSSIFGFTPANQATTITVAGTANQITSSAGAQDISANRTWTLSIPQNFQLPLSYTATYGTTTYASSTAMSATTICISTDCRTAWPTGVPFPFTPATNFNQNTSATTTALWAQGTPISFMASSTTWFDQINVGSTTLGVMATSTFYGNVEVKGNLRDDSISSALLFGDGIGDVIEYTGTTCSSEFVRSLDAAGVATCEPVNLASGGDTTGTLTVGSGGTGRTTFTSSQLLYGNGTAALSSVATTTLAFSGPFTGASALGALVGGSDSTVLWTGLATTSQPASSNLLVSNGGAGVYGIATTTLSGTANQVSVSNSPVVIGASGAALTLPNHVIFPSSYQAALGSTTNATSTNMTISGAISLFGGASVSTANALCIQLTGTADLCDDDDTGAGGAFSFTPLTNYGVNTSATTTPLWAQAGLFASSSTAYPTLAVQQSGAGSAATFLGGNVGIGTTSPYGLLSVMAPATSPELASIFNVSYQQGSSYHNVFNVASTSAGNSSIGIGTTSPWAMLAINPTATLGNNAAFAIGSTTQTTFYINNAGRVIAKDTTNNWTGTLSPTSLAEFGTGTTTAWTASTTGSAYSPFKPAPWSGTLRRAVCLTDASFLGVNISIAGTSVTPAYFIASTTGGSIAITANNTFTTGQKILVDFGTTTTSGAKAIDCILYVTET